MTEIHHQARSPLDEEWDQLRRDLAAASCLEWYGLRRDIEAMSQKVLAMYPAPPVNEDDDYRDWRPEYEIELLSLGHVRKSKSEYVETSCGDCGVVEKRRYFITRENGHFFLNFWVSREWDNGQFIYDSDVPACAGGSLSALEVIRLARKEMGEFEEGPTK